MSRALPGGYLTETMKGALASFDPGTGRLNADGPKSWVNLNTAEALATRDLCEVHRGPGGYWWAELTEAGWHRRRLLGMTRGEARQRLLETATRMGRRHAELGAASLTSQHGDSFLADRVALAAGVGRCPLWGVRETASAYVAAYMDVVRARA